jgi:hypothetical protein
VDLFFAGTLIYCPCWALCYKYKKSVSVRGSYGIDLAKYFFNKTNSFIKNNDIIYALALLPLFLTQDIKKIKNYNAALSNFF